MHFKTNPYRTAQRQHLKEEEEEEEEENLQKFTS